MEKSEKNEKINSVMHFREVDWSAKREKLYDIMIELEAAEDTGRPFGGVIVWREGRPYIVASEWLAKAAAHICALYEKEEITEHDVLKAFYRLKPKEKDNHAYLYTKDLEKMTEENPFSVNAHLYDALSRMTEAELKAVDEFVTNLNKRRK